jgi:multimeric flavodoxin WrbA
VLFFKSTIINQQSTIMPEQGWVNQAMENTKKVIAINGSYRRKGTTTELTKAALEGAASVGMDTEMILLRDKDIRYCTNCLTCYKDLDSEIAPCSIDDDMEEMLHKTMDADGVILSSAVHNGFVTGLMTVFFERMAWRVCRPTGRLFVLRGLPQPRSNKTRALATIVSAGGMPTRLGKMFCNDGTPFMRQNGCYYLNADWVGGVYAGAKFSKELRGEDWCKAYLYKVVTEEQLKEARELGIKMGAMIKADKLKPVHPFGRIGSLLDRVTAWFIRE